MTPRSLNAAERQLLQLLRSLQGQGLKTSEIIARVSELLQPEVEEFSIPVAIFKNGALGSLEAIVKYLRENQSLPFAKIAELTGRDKKALAVSYRVAKRKYPEPLSVAPSEFYVPVTILRDKKFSVLEHLVSHLRDSYNLRYHQVALLLDRDDRTVWTVYQRAKRKKVGK